MQKKISECKIEEILFNQAKNKSNKNYEEVYQVVLIMFDSIKDKPEAKGIEMEILNEAWKSVKPKIDKSVLDTIINV